MRTVAVCLKMIKFQLIAFIFVSFSFFENKFGCYSVHFIRIRLKTDTIFGFFFLFSLVYKIAYRAASRPNHTKVQSTKIQFKIVFFCCFYSSRLVSRTKLRSNCEAKVNTYTTNIRARKIPRCS